MKSYQKYFGKTSRSSARLTIKSEKLPEAQHSPLQ
jgi:hypothetical protein